VRAATGIYGLQRALFDGFAMSFLTLLKTESGVILEKLMVKHLLRGTALKVRHFYIQSIARLFRRSRSRGPLLMGLARSGVSRQRRYIHEKQYLFHL